MTRLDWLEIGSYLEVLVVWVGFRVLLKKNVLGEMIAGTIIGLFIELFTASYWSYHFKITVYRELPLCVLMGWGMMFTLAVFLSEFFYRTLTGNRTLTPGDPRILLTDVVGGLLITIPAEVISLRTGIYQYNDSVLDWPPYKIPVLDLPYMALICYALLMLFGPTFVRTWGPYFGGRRP